MGEQYFPFLTNEAVVLKRQRLCPNADLSVREAGLKIGKNHFNLVPIETNRLDPPSINA